MILNKEDLVKQDELAATKCDIVNWWRINGFVQDYSISSALATQVQPSCTKPSIYASSNFVTIGSGTGLLHIHRQTSTWTKADSVSIRHSGTDEMKF